MPTYGSPVLPNVSGLALGSASQPWAAFVTVLSFQRLASLSSNAATVGLLSMSNTDVLAWRNAANSANVTLGQSGIAVVPFDADLLVYTGSGIKAAEFVSPNLPATTGLIRLSNAETISWRNNANSGNVSITHNADDSLTLPNSTIPVISSTTVNATTVNATASVVSPQVQLGGTTAAFPMIKRNGAAVDVRLADSSALANLTCSTLIASNLALLANYNGIALFGNGVPSEVATVDLTGQVAPVTTTTIFNAPIAGWFRINAYLKITTAGTSPVLGPVTIGYTDGTDSVVQSVIMSCQTQAGVQQATGNAGNTTVSTLSGSLVLYAKAATAITYAIALTGTVGAGVFAVRLRLEAM